MMKCDVVFLTLSLDLNAYSKKAVPAFPLNTFVIKNDLIFLCVYFGLQAIIVAVF